MSTVQIDILNPKANEFLKNLAELKLISIRKPGDGGFIALVKKFRAKVKNDSPTLSEITKEVELVRAARYAKRKK